MKWWRFVPILVVALAIAVWNAPREPVGAASKPADAIALHRSAPAPRVVAPEASDAELKWGATFFEDAARWSESEGVRVDRIETFHCRLDAMFELDSHRLEGLLRLWFRAPGSFRQERTTHAGTTTHILAGERGWLIHPDGQIEELSASQSGREELAHARLTQDRFVDLFSAITLRPLRRGKARFSFAGYKRGSGTYAGNWIKLVRHAPGTRRVMCWLAYDRTSGSEVHVTWPGVVRLEDEGERGSWTEDWILKEWISPLTARGTGRRFPRRIEAYAIEKDEVGRTLPRRFLFAVVDDLEINEPVEDGLFAPPE